MMLKTSIRRLRPLCVSSNQRSVSTGTSKAKKLYDPDFSITPTTYAYQLPIPGERDEDIRVSASPISMVFEITGVDTATSAEIIKKSSDDFNSYPLMSFKKLNRSYTNLMHQKEKNKAKINIERPRKIRLTSKDFIDDSLYNPSYGYFNKDVEIFNIEPFDYSKITSIDHFMDEWTLKYAKYQQRSKQLWHTPTELFQPHYGNAVAKYLVTQFAAQKDQSKLIIYEVGAGNGTLMNNVLTYISENHPEIFAKTEYRIIEISSKLVKKQTANVSKFADKVKILPKDIFQWTELVEEECYFMAFEVFDNFAHDVIKYNINTYEPYQGYVLIDNNNEFKEYFNPKLDHWTQKYLEMRSKTEYFQKLESRSSISKALNPMSPTDELYELSSLKNYLWPFRFKLSESSEFIPTKLLEFFDILHKYFPKHHLLATDFSKLEGTIPYSYNGPVVQTYLTRNVDNKTQVVEAKPVKGQDPAAVKKDKNKYKYHISRISRDKMVNVTTYMVHQGYFDIMFPTNFEQVCQLYTLTTGKKLRHSTHKEFLLKYADYKKTECLNGENPMLEFYKNVEFMHE